MTRLQEQNKTRVFKQLAAAASNLKIASNVTEENEQKRKTPVARGQNWTKEQIKTDRYSKGNKSAKVENKREKSKTGKRTKKQRQEQKKAREQRMSPAFIHLNIQWLVIELNWVTGQFLLAVPPSIGLVFWLAEWMIAFFFFSKVRSYL